MLETRDAHFDNIQSELRAEIHKFILQKNYPCIAAVQAVARHEFILESYGRMGAGRDWRRLRVDLLKFLARRRATDSPYLSFFAVFEPAAMDEARFETAFWHELSLLSSLEERARDWSAKESSDPNTPSFCISLDGEKLFVVGLHPESSRRARRFSRPAMVFNAFAQFEKFEADGTYGAMVDTNRRRDRKFQGSVNPMVEKHGDRWEAIQFSGRENPDDWKCPFHFHREKEKPE